MPSTRYHMASNKRLKPARSRSQTNSFSLFVLLLIITTNIMARTMVIMAPKISIVSCMKLAFVAASITNHCHLSVAFKYTFLNIILYYIFFNLSTVMRLISSPPIKTPCTTCRALYLFNTYSSSPFESCPNSLRLFLKESRIIGENCPHCPS